MVARRRGRSRRPRPTPTPEPPPHVPTAEALLLALAREVSVRAREVVEAANVFTIAGAVAAAYAPDAPLATALREDWLHGRGEKTAALALGWAREQLRLALADVLQRARDAGVLRADGDVETLSWLWLAASEALAFETPAAVPDRVHALTAFLTSAER